MNAFMLFAKKFRVEYTQRVCEGGIIFVYPHWDSGLC
jgi:hypothetical protein